MNRHEPIIPLFYMGFQILVIASWVRLVHSMTKKVAEKWPNFFPQSHESEFKKEEATRLKKYRRLLAAEGVSGRET